MGNIKKFENLTLKYFCEALLPHWSYFRMFVWLLMLITTVLSINQSINQSIPVFQRNTQTVQFTNIYKHILFFTWLTYDHCDSEDYWILWVVKQNEGSSCIAADEITHFQKGQTLRILKHEL